MHLRYPISLEKTQVEFAKIKVAEIIALIFEIF
jgi:hypothetical protein